VPFNQKLLNFVFDLANGDHVAVSGLRVVSQFDPGDRIIVLAGDLTEPHGAEGVS
jgi:hypothetical protein